MKGYSGEKMNQTPVNKPKKSEEIYDKVMERSAKMFQNTTRISVKNNILNSENKLKIFLLFYKYCRKNPYLKHLKMNYLRKIVGVSRSQMYYLLDDFFIERLLIRKKHKDRGSKTFIHLNPYKTALWDEIAEEYLSKPKIKGE